MKSCITFQLQQLEQPRSPQMWPETKLPGAETCVLCPRAAAAKEGDAGFI